MLYVFLFFFSSRRRHTRYWRDWSSDVCSSDLGTSILEKLDASDRIHGRFNAFGTATGRFSSSDPNLQNIPKRGERGAQMRGLFWSGAEDRVLIKADYASIELWRAAVRWEDPYMQDALQQGVNMHVATAAALFNVKAGGSLRSKIRVRITSAFPAYSSVQ